MSNDELELLKLRADYAWNWFDLHAKQRMTLFNYFLIIAGILANAILLSYKDPSPSGATATGVDLRQSASGTASTTQPSAIPFTFAVEQRVSRVALPIPPMFPAATTQSNTQSVYQHVIAPTTAAVASTPAIVTVDQSVAQSTPLAAPLPSVTISQLPAIRKAIAILGFFVTVVFIVFDNISRRLTSRAEAVLKELERAVLFPKTFSFDAETPPKALGILLQESPQNTGRLLRMKWWILLLECAIGLGFVACLFL